MLSDRARAIGFSPTLAVSDLAARLRAKGEDVLDFAAGQPDFPTPDPVKAAGKRAIDENRTGYTATAGVPELRRAIAARLERDLGVRYDEGQILVSPGAKASLYFAFQAMLDPGDRMIVPTPYWTSYPEQLRLAGAEPLFVECPQERGFKLTPEQIDAAAGDRVKAILLNYPSNPTGACYSLDELRPLVEACVRNDLWIVADEIYSKLIYDGKRFASVVQVAPEVRDRTVLIDGVSKSYSMTGWRIGYTAAPKEIISGMAKLQSHSTSNATSISQWASVGALEMDDEELTRRAVEFQRRRDEMVSGLREIDGVECTLPGGAFYVFPDVSGCFRGAVDSGQALATHLLERARVAVVPGEAFGAPKHIRMSYAVSLERVREGMARVADALAELKRS